MGSISNPLNIIIVGAGLGGFTAAIGLRQQGHSVTLYERSSGDNETGAALLLGPNATSILSRLEVSFEGTGMVQFDHMAEFSNRGEPVRSLDLREHNKRFKSPSGMINRIILHRTLRKAALSPDRAGSAVIHYNQKAVSVDPALGSVTFQDGTTATADLVLGYEGVHSLSRKNVSGSEARPFTTGKSAFRFLIPRKTTVGHPAVAKFNIKHNELLMIKGKKSRIIMYPCDNNENLNFACFHPDTPGEAEGTGLWSSAATREELMKAFEDYDEHVLSLISLADSSTLRKWKILDMEALPKWTNGRFAVMDQGQGAAVAIEDGVSISVLLPMGTSPSEIPARLELWEKTRYARASEIQNVSRLLGQDDDGSAPKFDVMRFTAYNMGHNEYKNSERVLQTHLAGA